MVNYILFNFINNEKLGTVTVQAAAMNYETGVSPKVTEHFSITKQNNELDKIYYAFEDFCFKYQSAKLCFWGAYHKEQLESVALKANANIGNIAHPNEFVNLQYSFKNYLKMKSFAKFNYAYEKVAGLHKLKFQKGYEFYKLDHIVHFMPYALGDKYFQRMDRSGKKE